MILVFRILTGLVALGFFAQAVQWILTPESMAASLGMELLTGMGASTQIGDIGAFFLCVSVTAALGQRPGQTHWFYMTALLLGSAAIMRTLAFVSGNAPFGAEFIAPEAIIAVIFVVAARTRADEVAVGSTAE